MRRRQTQQSGWFSISSRKVEPLRLQARRSGSQPELIRGLDSKRLKYESLPIAKLIIKLNTVEIHYD